MKSHNYRAFLGTELEIGEARLQWKQRLRAAGLIFPESGRIVGDNYTRNAREFSAMVQASLLASSYGNEYCFKEDKKSSNEHVYFWGAEEAVSEFLSLSRQYMRNASEGATNISVPELGTAAFVRQDSFFGEGFLELGRTASNSAKVGLSLATFYMLDRLFEQRRVEFKGYHTLVTTPRNRVNTLTVRGGSAVQRLHAREIGSPFLGFACWYRLQKGLLECLDYREIPLTYSYTKSSVSVALTDSREFQFVKNLLGYSLGIRVSNDLVSVDQRTLHFVANSNETPDTSPCIVRPKEIGGQPLEEVVRITREGLSTSVVLPISIGGYINFQRYLQAQGFVLTAISFGVRNPFSVGTVFGIWTRVQEGTEVALPYYLDKVSKVSIREAAIYKYLRSCLLKWKCQIKE